VRKAGGGRQIHIIKRGYIASKRYLVGIYEKGRSGLKRGVVARTANAGGEREPEKWVAPGAIEEYWANGNPIAPQGSEKKSAARDRGI